MNPLAKAIGEYANSAPVLPSQAYEYLVQAEDEINKLVDANAALVNIIIDTSAHWKRENDRLREIEAMYEGLCK